MNDEEDEEGDAGDEPVSDASDEDAREDGAPPEAEGRAPVPLAWEAAVVTPASTEPGADASGDGKAAADEAGEADGEAPGEGPGDVRETGDEDVADAEEDGNEDGVDEALSEADDEELNEEGEVGGQDLSSETSANDADDQFEDEPADDEPVHAQVVEDDAADASVSDVDESEGETVAVEQDSDGAAGDSLTPEPLVDPPTGLAMAASGVASRAPAVIQYAKRNARLDKQDCGWWVDGDYLYETDGRGREWRTHLGDVLEVQTAPAPAKFRPWRHQTILGLRNSRRIAIDNAHYLGTAHYEERSAAYAPFVRQLIEVIAEKAPYAKARRGASYLGYVAMLVFVFVLIGLVATLVFLLPIEGVPGIVWIKAGLVALMAPPLLAWVAKSRPTGMRLADLPPGALPRARP